LSARKNTRSFGAVEISRRRYTALLDNAIKSDVDFWKLPADRPIAGAEALDIIAARG
jgi:leucyl/phenylalanyl-tRNA--protein transferase